MNPGKELPQEVKDLLPVAQTDLKDGSQATPTQPSQTEVKTTEGTWSFKSYDKTSETVNERGGTLCVGTWEFDPHSLQLIKSYSRVCEWNSR